MQYLKKYLIVLGAAFCIISQYHAQPLKTYAHYKLIEKQSIEEQTGTLVMSNSPEEVKETGILYKGELEGIGRLLYHHVNVSEEKKLRLIIEKIGRAHV